MITSSANLVRYNPSSIAASPPPTTTTFLPRKKAPSQVAQYDTPRPLNPSSPGTPNNLGLEPAAIMIARASRT